MDKERLLRWMIPKRHKPPQPIAPGLYPYAHEEDGALTRFHLRVEPDGQGMLLANATAAARLNPAGVVMVKELLDGVSPDDVLDDVLARFKGASKETIAFDLQRVRSLLSSLASPDDNYPIINFNEIQVNVFESQLLAPLEASVPLAAPEKMVPILDKMWNVGIPHVTFLAPEQPNAAHLVRAVERAEDLGLIAGVRGRATDLHADNLLLDLAQAGVDHVTVLYAAADAAIHDALCGAGDHALVADLYATIEANEVCPVAEIPLVESTLDILRQTLTRLWDAGVSNFSFFAIVAPEGMSDADRAGALTAQAMPQTAAWVEEIAHQADVLFIWQPPVQRDPRLTLAEQVRLGPRCSGDAAVRIEANGDVIPPRGPYLKAGNLLADPWQQIWGNDAFVRYRERVTAPTRCMDCPGLVICEADCPREQSSWAQGVEGALA
ncbi:MAG: SPASM domain-containing protein [Ardenticatenaceae bacterium]|nr:SPASM domain-containing protein [Ardenticatenaceae bacterium]